MYAININNNPFNVDNDESYSGFIKESSANYSDSNSTPDDYDQLADQITLLAGQINADKKEDFIAKDLGLSEDQQLNRQEQQKDDLQKESHSGLPSAYVFLKKIVILMRRLTALLIIKTKNMLSLPTLIRLPVLAVALLNWARRFLGRSITR